MFARQVTAKPLKHYMKKVLALVLVSLLATLVVAAQEKKEGKKMASAAKESRWEGTIQRQNKDESTLVVKKGIYEKTVLYNGSTQWTKVNKPGEASMFKDGERVIVIGKYDDQGRLIASRIDLRRPR